MMHLYSKIQAGGSTMSFFFNDYKNELHEAFKLPDIKTLAESDVFYFQKARKKFDEFSEYSIANMDIPTLIASTKRPKFSFENWLSSYDETSDEYKLLLLIGQVISYFDFNAAMKNKLNAYDDKRVLAKAAVRQNKWVKWLLEFKLGTDIHTFPSNIRNAILYIQNPEANINIISDDYRKAIKENLLGEENLDLFAQMKKLGITARNPLNNGVLYTWILYSDVIKKRWLESKNKSDTVNPQSKKQSNAAFLKWFEPLISALKDLGGSATRKEAYDRIIENCGLSTDDIHFSKGKNGASKILTEIAWARQYLVFAGYIDNFVKGKWTLTPKGYTAPMNAEIASDIFVKHANIRSRGTRYWIYTPGEQARFWNEFSDKDLMGIGWDYLGDLTEYASKTDIKIAMQQFNEDDKSHKNASLAVWQFANELSIGDVVYVKKGYSIILGRGIVDSEYIFDEQRGEYKHIRQMNWTHIGEYEHPGQAVQKTLTDITPYTEYIEKLEALFGIEKDDDDNEIEISYDKYISEDFLREVYMNTKQYDTMKGLLLRKKNLILQGAPGVGKTFAAERLAFSIMGEEDTSRVKVIQFHQSYSYEDFIMGWRPDGAKFALSEGPFYKFCKTANDDDERDYFFIIDEINRGNLSKIFGELLMLIEEDKRGKSIRLLYKDEQFSVPKNMHIIGMMNTADRSLAMIDYALRRRFAFFNLNPAFQSDGFIKYQKDINLPSFDSLVSTVEKLNVEISEDASLGDGFKIGHSYFCAEKQDINNDWLTDVVEYELIPLLQEYWFDEPSKAEGWIRQLRGAVNGR